MGVGANSLSYRSAREIGRFEVNSAGTSGNAGFVSRIRERLPSQSNGLRWWRARFNLSMILSER
jgi:hypothetical protein